jgi:hypothetical protein
MATTPSRIDKQLQSTKLAEANKKEKEAKAAYETELARLTKLYTDDLKVDATKHKEVKRNEIQEKINAEEIRVGSNLKTLKDTYTTAKTNVNTLKDETETSFYDKTAYGAKRRLEELGEKIKPISYIAKKTGQDRFSKAQSNFNAEKRREINDRINNLKDEYKTADDKRRVVINTEIKTLMKERVKYEGEGSVKVGRTMAKAANLSSEAFRPAAKLFKQQFSVTDRTVLEETVKELGQVQQELDRINGLIDKPDFKGVVLKGPILGTPAQVIGRSLNDEKLVVDEGTTNKNIGTGDPLFADIHDTIIREQAETDDINIQIKQAEATLKKLESVKAGLEQQKASFETNIENIKTNITEASGDISKNLEELKAELNKLMTGLGEQGSAMVDNKLAELEGYLKKLNGHIGAAKHIRKTDDSLLTQSNDTTLNGLTESIADFSAKYPELKSIAEDVSKKIAKVREKLKEQQSDDVTETDALAILGLKNDVLDGTMTFRRSEINRAYRLLALKHHPDKKGDPEKFKKLGPARDFLLGADEETYSLIDVLNTFTNSLKPMVHTTLISRVVKINESLNAQKLVIGKKIDELTQELELLNQLEVVIQSDNLSEGLEKYKDLTDTRPLSELIKKCQELATSFGAFTAELESNQAQLQQVKGILATLMAMKTEKMKKFQEYLAQKFPFLYLSFEEMPSAVGDGMKGGAPPLDPKKTYYKETSPNFYILIDRAQTFRDETLYKKIFGDIDLLVRKLNYLVAFKEELEKRKREEYLKGTAAAPAYDTQIQNINRLIDEKKEEFKTKYTDYLKKVPSVLANYDSVIINRQEQLDAFKKYFELAGKPANLKFYSDDGDVLGVEGNPLGKKIEPLNTVTNSSTNIIELTGKILYLYSDNIDSAFAEKQKYPGATVTLMQIIEPQGFFIKDIRSLVEAITSELKESLPESKKKALEAQEQAKREAEGSAVQPEEMLTTPELNVYSRVFPHPFVNSKGYRIGNWHVIVDTSKLPFNSIDEANHFLYNLFEYVNYEGTPKTSKEMERAITDFFKYKETKLPAFTPIRYPDEEEQKFKKMQKELLDKENAKMRANLRRLRNELAGVGYGTKEYEENKKLREELTEEIEKKFMDASGKPKPKEENQKLLAAYAEAIEDEDDKLSGNVPIFEPEKWKEDGTKFPMTAKPVNKAAMKGGKRKSTNGSIKNRKWRKGKKNNKTKRS